tara:strand:+ start:270 stop:1025 length:756 start_codon:yes stop_codon:yes gene_type:complete
MIELLEPKKIATTLKKLKNDEDYYGDFGRQFLSNSDIKQLLTNPVDFRKPQEDSKAFLVGRYFHQCILEPEKAKDFDIIAVASRTTKAYKEMKQELGREILLEKEKLMVDEMVSRMKGNFDFFDDIYLDGNTYEVPAVGKIMGLLFKGKADIVCDNCLIDLKTSADISKFRWSAYTYNYDSQCYIYQVLFGKPLKFFVIDKQTLLMGKFNPSEKFVESGKHKVMRAIEVYERYYGENSKEDASSFFIEETL